MYIFFTKIYFTNFYGEFNLIFRVFKCVKHAYDQGGKAIYLLGQSMAGTEQGQAGTRQGQTGTRQGQTGTSRDKQGQSLSVRACPCLSRRSMYRLGLILI